MHSPWLADAIVGVHLAYVGFVISGYVAVPLGWARGWRWVRNRAYRRVHMAAIAFVAVEALLGWVCPLTEWEALLRGGAPPESFMGRIVHAVLFYDAPPWAFTAAYLALTAAAVALYWLVPPAAPAAASPGTPATGGASR